MDKKLQELKNIIIKYYTSPTTPEHLSMVLFDIFECEADLRTHSRLEDDLFVPAVKILELSTEQAADKDSASNAETNPETAFRSASATSCAAWCAAWQTRK